MPVLRSLCRLLLAAAAIALTPHRVYAQAPDTGENQTLQSTPTCKGINFEKERYTIGDVSIQGPFDFPWWRKAATAGGVQDQLKGKPFTYQLVVDDTLKTLKGKSKSTSGGPAKPGSPIQVTVSLVSATRCDTEGHIVDLAYRIYSIPPRNMLSGTPESQDQARKAPQDATGVTSGGSPIHAVPTASFNGWKQIALGGQVAITGKSFSVTAQGTGSASEYDASAAASGAHNFAGSIARMDWRFNAVSASHPTLAGRLAHTQFSGQWSAATRPFADGNLMGRFGGLVEGGNYRSDLPAAELAADTIANATYISGKFYGGISSRMSHNVLSVSSGIEVGSVRSSPGGHWRKIIGDVVDEFWIPLADHRALEVETRFNAGGIPSARSIPVAAKFFGGNHDASFISGESWQIRDRPVIRAIQSDRLFMTATGAGAEMFASLNTTVAFPIWRKPMVPTVVTTEVLPLLQGQIVSATSLLQNNFASKDPGFQEILKILENLGPALASLKSAVAAARLANPGKFPSEFQNCSDNIDAANFFLGKMNGAKDKYSLAVSMPSSLADVTKSCGAALNGQLNDAAVRTGSDAVAGIAQQVTVKNQALQKVAAAKAKKDTAFVSRIINTLVKDFNIVSIAPAGIFDWAYIGPAGSGIRGSRRGPGGGIRLELATYVTFTLGYARNIDRQPGEGKGALFFSIGLRDILH